MDQKTRLIIAKMQVENLIQILKDNQYGKMMHSHLSALYYELERQLSHESVTQEIPHTTRHGGDMDAL
jgi:hypothetical protein